jgi:DNA repair protein RAD7
VFKYIFYSLSDGRSHVQANNISAAQIRDDYERRRREADANDEGASNANADPAAVDEDEDELAQPETEAAKKKRKREEKEAIDAIKNKKKEEKKTKKSKGKPKKKPKKGDPDDDDGSEYDGDLGNEMYKKARPAPGQFEHCEICSKRFTVTPYSKAGPDGGLLCTPCGKELAKDEKAAKKPANKPVGRKRRKLESDRLDGFAAGGAKTLQQICIETVAKYHDDIEELGDMPAPIVERLSEIFSKRRVLKPKSLPLFLRPDLEQVILHDAAYLEVDDYKQIFAVVPNIRKLVLGNTCQMKDEAMAYMLDKCHNLQHLQMYAANLVTNEMWQRYFEGAGDKLETIKLKWLDAAFEDETVKIMASRCPNLKRLKLELCRRIGEAAVEAIANMPKLEHLSLQIGLEVSADTLVNLVQQRGSHLRTLSLRKFLDADDAVLDTIHEHCRRLSKLRVSENDTASDSGYARLFTDWSNPPLSFVDFNTTRDIDNNNPDGPEDAIGFSSSGFRAMMKHSGSNLKHLDISSCRHIELGAFIDVFNGAESYPLLEYINVSFCNRVDTTVIAGIFKSCPVLKKLVAFGCFDVADVVVPRNIALIGVPRAQDAIEQFGVGIDVEEALGRMIEVGA